MAPTVPIDYTGQKESRKCSLSQAMGKSRKYSKGLPNGFVPDYRHAVETICESEGFGSSGRVDTEMNASEDSCAQKRNCISLNVDGNNSFGVPIQILSLSKMSQSERKELEFKLRMELEQVQILQKKIYSLGSNILSASDNVRSSSDGQKTAPPGNLSASQGKKRAPPGRNGPRTKKGISGNFEPVKPAAPASNSIASLMKQCETLLNRLMSHQFGWVFNTPVDVVKLNIPDYFTVIKHPMDLGTVKRKLATGEYSGPLGFAADVRLTFSNAMIYNPPGNDVHFMAETLSKYFEVRWKAIEKKLPVVNDVPSVHSGAFINKGVESNPQIPPSKKMKITANDSVMKPDAFKKIMTDKEKHKLSVELESLLGELSESIVDFLKEHSNSSGQTSEDEIEIHIDALSNDTLFALRKLLDDYMLEKQKNQPKAEPCELELRNESGFSNSSMQPCKENDAADEDVDVVGGNDLQVSSYPQAEIEKDEAHRNCKCSSSSRSSSESGSSLSDSGSGSTSESDSENAKVLDPASSTKELLGCETILDQKRGDGGDSDNRNYSENGIGLDEQNSQSKRICVEIDGRQEGENAPPERQVSPEKLYRAALLRNRFADTILRAREKTLEKDPEKLRLEREELERQQKEEKARLQAEAKAAEEARRKAELEAAAEAKKKRELEREAARQALLQMERTVEINENSQLMEDLEMLRSSYDEQLPSFIEEKSPDNVSQNGLGSFKLQGSSNPLEQLGLYMKADEEDEEEESEPPQDGPKTPTNDVEEGEID